MRRLMAADPSKVTLPALVAGQTRYRDSRSERIVTSTSKPGSVRHTDGVPPSMTSQNTRG